MASELSEKMKKIKEYNRIDICIGIKASEDEMEFAVVSKEGDLIPNGKLFKIGQKGLVIYGNINPDIGLPLDEKGNFRIIMENQ